ncbi:MAG: response regulator [Parvularcula sp.]|jgi:FixJ family two-component response regulator|nr:response regulator [Parvularcula sp.]
MSRKVSPPCPSRVVVIEDDSAVRDALLMVLLGAGIEAAGFPSGDAFLEGPMPEDDDLVLLDIDLPGRSGVEVSSTMRARGCRTPIFVISGLRGNAFQKAVREIAPLAALRKPLDGEALLAALARA